MKKFFKGASEFLSRYFGILYPIIVMGYLLFFVIYACVSSGQDFWTLILAIVSLCFLPFISGYIFRKWLNSETKNHITNSRYVYDKIDELKKDLDLYSKEDLVDIMTFFEDYNKDVRELL